jgi:phage FluMu protein Com
MAATVVCTHCGAKLTLKSAIAPGKKVNCPKCKKAFVVEDDEEPEDEETAAESGDEAPPPKKQKKAAKKDDDEPDDDHADDDDDEKPAKKKKPEPKKKSSAGLILGIVGVLLLCCCGGTGGGVWYSWAWFGASTVVIKDAGKNKDAIAADGKPKLDNDTKDKDKIADKLKDKSKDKDKTKGPDLSKPEFVTTAEQFSAEFAKDFDAAYKKYSPKLVEFTGEASGITIRRDIFDKKKQILKLYVKGEPNAGKTGFKNTLYLTVAPSDFPIAYRIADGQKVKIVARFVTYTGKEQLGFADGKITELTKSNILEVSSEELATEFEKSPAEAAKKFAKKQILVSGEVVEFKKLAAIGHETTLKGKGKTAVWFYVGPDDCGENERVKVGANVVVRTGICKYEAFRNRVILENIMVTSLDATISPPKK